MQFDKGQNGAYLEDSNTAVSAGAGSGKTTVLAERFVRLVTERGLNVSEVLTLTFTRKAAAEMYERIFNRLSESEHPLAKERLDQFDQARISTLDAFCSSVIRGASYRYGIPGNFRIDNAELRKIAEETAIQILMKYRRENTIGSLVASRNFEAASGDLFAGLALSVFSLTKNGNFADGAKRQTGFLQQETGKYCAQINTLCEAVLDFDKMRAREKDQETIQKIQGAIRSRYPLKAVFDRESIETLVETAIFFKSSKSYKKIPVNVKDDVMAEIRSLWNPVKDAAGTLETITKNLRFSDDILVLGMIFDEYEKIFLESKRQKGIISFKDAAELSVDILKNDPGLRSYYKKRIKAVMIDEFQDNNELQKNLLYLLAERDDAGGSAGGKAGVIPSAEDLDGSKLFFVGDEKQSIYRFRGADVSVFRGLSAELQGKTHSLSTNYRSTPELVAFFNALFPGVFGTANAQYEAGFEAMEADPKKEPGMIEGAAVELYVWEKSRKKNEDSDSDAGNNDDTGGEETEALAAARRIIEGVERGEFSYGDIAVLFKSTTHQNKYEEIFRRTGIPFSAADPRGLFLEGPANDFYAYLRLSLFPLDRNAYATVLRSPFISLGDECVFKIMLEKPDEPFTPDYGEAWFDNDAEKERYEHGRCIFNELCSKIDAEGIAEVISWLWYQSGYRTFLLYDRASRPNLGHFEYLYSLALEADSRRLTMAAFIDELAPRMGTTEKTDTGEVPDQKDEVLFLTVHKSKGLQFRVVIIANAGSARSEKNGGYFFIDPEYGPAVNFKLDTEKRSDSAVNYFYTLRREELQKRSDAELKRLFYVAATRAKERLMIFGSREINDNDRKRLQGLEGPARFSALIAGSHAGTTGEIQLKSFLDLFSSALETAAKQNTPKIEFQLTELVPCDYESFENDVKQLRSRNSTLKDAVQNSVTVQGFYDIAPPEKPEPFPRSVTPSLMEAAAGHDYTGKTGDLSLPAFRCEKYLETVKAELPEDAGSENEEDNPYADIDLDGEAGAEGRRKFGTLCHRMIEILFLNEKQDTQQQQTIPGQAALDEASAIFGSDTTERNLKALSEEALDIARRFLDSSTGREALKSYLRKNEFPFLLPLHSGDKRPVIVKGTIDLIYELDDCCRIVDFKTDHYLDTEKHAVQMSCYRKAAAAFSDKPPTVVLVYLRNMQSVPVDFSKTETELYALAEKAGKGA
ncbi:ATPase AAA [Spirochaetia bacterium]|nr:ATPase AAA [Spirochaetia bacterium]